MASYAERHGNAGVCTDAEERSYAQARSLTQECSYTQGHSYTQGRQRA